MFEKNKKFKLIFFILNSLNRYVEEKFDLKLMSKKRKNLLIKFREFFSS